MKLSIYGKGCNKCQQLTDNALQAASALGLSPEIEKVTDINAIIDAGVMHTPALGVDGEVVLEGKVASTEEIGKLLSR